MANRKLKSNESIKYSIYFWIAIANCIKIKCLVDVEHCDAIATAITSYMIQPHMFFLPPLNDAIRLAQSQSQIASSSSFVMIQLQWYESIKHLIYFWIAITNCIKIKCLVDVEDCNVIAASVYFATVEWCDWHNRNRKSKALLFWTHCNRKSRTW